MGVRKTSMTMARSNFGNTMTAGMWWRNAVIYQIYVRSFQDSDGDGVGDLRGVLGRLGHLADLGVTGIWLSPIHPSPLVDFGYDVADFMAVDPVYGELADFDALVAGAHEQGLRVVMDLVLGHTSIEHPWFRIHPDWYIRAKGACPPSNWRSMFGGSAWSRDSIQGDWYLHTFHREQPDLNWRNPEVVAAMQDVVRFWRARGVDGFRLDATSLLMKDPLLRDDPPTRARFPLPLPDHYAQLDHVRSAMRADSPRVLAALRSVAGDAFLVAEAYLPTADLEPYLGVVDAVFAFEFLFAPWHAPSLATTIDAGDRLRRQEPRGLAWVLSNHDFGRVASRVGAINARSAAMLLLTLPGVAFLYQGDEIGMTDGADTAATLDYDGRDRYRHPMPWDQGPAGGFTSGSPWLPVHDARRTNVAAQLDDPGSMLTLHRELVTVRRRMNGPLRGLRADGGVLTFERGAHVVTINTAREPARVPLVGRTELATEDGVLKPDGRLAGHAGVIMTRS
jgi:alpha-glucosidase